MSDSPSPNPSAGDSSVPGFAPSFKSPEEIVAEDSPSRPSGKQRLEPVSPLMKIKVAQVAGNSPNPLDNRSPSPTNEDNSAGPEVHVSVVAVPASLPAPQSQPQVHSDDHDHLSVSPNPTFHSGTQSHRRRHSHSVSRSQSMQQEIAENADLQEMLGSTLENAPETILSIGKRPGAPSSTEMTPLVPGSQPPKLQLHASADQAAGEAGHGQSIMKSLKLRRKSVSRKKSVSHANASDAGGANGAVQVDAQEAEEEGEHEPLMVDIYHLTQPNPYVVLPTNPYRIAWDFLVSIFVLYFCWKVPFLLCFPANDHFHGKGWFEFEIFLLCFFWLDVILNFRTAFIHGGHIITDDKEIALHYLKSWFIFDVVATFPWEFVLDVKENDRTAVKLSKIFKLAKLLRIGRLIGYLGKYFKFRHIMFWIFFTCILAHWFTNLWFFLETVHNEDISLIIETGASDLWQAYVDTLTEVVLHMFGIGASNSVYTSIGLDLLSIVIVIVGQILLGFLYASIFVIIHSSRSQHDKFRSKMESIITHMASLNLDDSLQSKVKAYYDYLWTNKKGSLFGGDLLFEDDDLNHEIKKAVGIHLIHTSFPLRKIKMFQHFSDDVLAALAQRMKTHVFMPGDYICRRGEFGTSLYLIQKGTVEVLLKEDTKSPKHGRGHGHGHGHGHEEAHDPILDSEEVRPKLTTGAVLGEVALLTEGLRTASVRAVTVVEMAVLEKDDLLHVLEPFPQHLNFLAEMAIERLEAERLRKASERKAAALASKESSEAQPAAKAASGHVQRTSSLFVNQRLDQLHAFHSEQQKLLSKSTTETGSESANGHKPAEEEKASISVSVSKHDENRAAAAHIPSAIAEVEEEDEELAAELEAFTRRTASVLASFAPRRPGSMIAGPSPAVLQATQAFMTFGRQSVKQPAVAAPADSALSKSSASMAVTADQLQAVMSMLERLDHKIEAISSKVHHLS